MSFCFSKTGLAETLNVISELRPIPLSARFGSTRTKPNSCPDTWPAQAMSSPYGYVTMGPRVSHNFKTRVFTKADST